jgi:hypothetical protein
MKLGRRCPASLGRGVLKRYEPKEKTMVLKIRDARGFALKL